MIQLWTHGVTVFSPINGRKIPWDLVSRGYDVHHLLGLFCYDCVGNTPLFIVKIVEFIE